MNNLQCEKKGYLKILLTGNPNVGKSVVFWRLTGLETTSSNFPGTTVGYTKGKTVISRQNFELIDVPGCYSMDASNKAEEAAVNLIKENSCDIVLHIIDSTALERNLFFALQIIETEKPVIFLLNKWDIAKLKGIEIDCDKLSEKLGVEVIPFVAVTGEGREKLSTAVENILKGKYRKKAQLPSSDEDRWKFIGTLSGNVQKITHKHPTFLERLAELSINPVSGLIMAAAILISSLFAVRLIGEGLINGALTPLYENIYLPFINYSLGGIKSGFLKSILLGTSGVNEFGILTEGINIAFVTVLPYIFAFYLIISFLEDLGYLPRLSVLLDNFLHKVGLHGYASIPMILGLGCKVPAILALRTLETRRERIIAAAMTLIITPCAPQSALIFAALSKHGFHFVILVFLILFLVSVVTGMLLNKMIKGETPELFMEIPKWHFPHMNTLLFKLKFRLKAYIWEAVPLILLGVLLINLGKMSGVINHLVKFFKYPVSFVFGLPPESISAIILGFLRKDISIAMLTPFNMTAGQLVTASVFLSMYLPCMAVLMVVIKELGMKDGVKVVLFNLTAAGLIAAGLNFIRIIF